MIGDHRAPWVVVWIASDRPERPPRVDGTDREKRTIARLGAGWLATDVEFRILGPLQVVQDGRPVPLGRRKQRALLGLLLLHAGEPLSTDRLIEDLWPQNPPQRAPLSLQTYVSHLRRVLEPDRTGRAPDGPLALRPGGYVLTVAPGRLDARRFERLVQEARGAAAAGDAGTAEARYAEALALWRGDVLADVAADLPPQPEITRLTELRLTALEEQTAVGLDQGRHAALVPELEALVLHHPFRERLREQLAVALYRCGRQADALERLRQTRALLVDELGIDPGPGLRRVEQLILRQAPELDRRLPPAPPGRVARAAGRTRLVGRERELEVLRDAFAAAAAGRGRLVLVAGEPGVGKTRLAEELAAHAAANGAMVVWGRSAEVAGAPALWPWAQLLGELAVAVPTGELRRLLGPRAASVAELVPEVAERLGIAGEPGVPDAAEARFRIYDGVLRLLLRLAEAPRPLVLVLDDLHWADQPSLDLLRLLAARVRDTRIAIVATYRDTSPDRGPALAAALAGLTREAPIERIALRGLGVPGVAALVDDQLGAAVGQDVVAELHARTAGNPFFLCELVRLLRDRGTDSGMAPGDVWQRVPDGVREVIERRVGVLPRGTAELLEAAAVVGREFAVPELGRALERSALAILEGLEPAVAAGLVGPVDGSPDAYRFAHALVRETIYEGLPRVRRIALHGAVGMALEKLGDERRLSEVAHHLEQAVALGPAGRAVDAALRAAERAERLGALEQAEDHLRRALALLADDGDPARELAARSRLAAVLVMAQGYTAPELPAVAGRVRALAARAPDAPAVAEVVWVLWTYTCVRAEFGPALEIAEELIDRGERTGDAAAVAAGLHARGTTRWHLGRLPEAAGDLRAAIVATAGMDEVAFRRRSLQHPALLARAHASQALWLLGDVSGAEDVIATARTLADAGGTPYERAFARYFSGWHGVVRHEFDEAGRYCHETLALCGEHGFRQLRAFAEILLGAVEARTGRPGAGVDRLVGGIDALRATGSRMLGHFHYTLLGEALLAAGRGPEAVLALDRALAESRATNETFYLAELLRLRADALVATRGDPGAARSSACEALRVAREQRAKTLAARAEATVAKLAARSGRGVVPAAAS